MSGFQDDRQKRWSRLARSLRALGGGALLKRALVAFLTLQLALSATPAQVWAEVADTLAAPAAEQAADETTEAPAPASDEQPADDEQDAPAQPAPAEDEQPAATDETPADDATAAAKPAAPADEDAGEDATAAVAATSAASVDDEAEAAAEVATEDTDASAPAEDATVDVSIKVIGRDAEGAEQVWLPYTKVEVKEGALASELTEAALADAGIKADCGVGSWGWSLNSITSPFDGSLTLAYDEVTWDYWQLFVDGAVSETGAGEVELHEGSSIVWYYSGWGAEVPVAKVSASLQIIGVDAEGKQQIWLADTYSMAEGSTAADLSEAAFAAGGITADYGIGGYGWFLSTITSPSTGEALGWDEATGRYWQLFVNGEPAASGASGIDLAEGDSVTWCYSAWGDTLPGQVSASVKVIGVDSAGNPQIWANEASYTLLEGASAADLSEAAFAGSGLTADYGASSWGWFLNTISSPYTGEAYGWDPATNAYWCLFVNGEFSKYGAGEVDIEPGDSIVWCYTNGTDLPDTDTLIVDPDAERPDYASDWGSFSNGAATTAPTPAESAELKWAYRFPSSGRYTTVSDPLIINGDVYAVSGSSIIKIDGETGKMSAMATIGATMGYFCRPVYTDGVIIVPLDDGSLAAFTADTLTCVWKTAALDGEDYQALSSLTVVGDYVYAGFTVPNGSNPGTAGALRCVRVSDGAVMWTNVSTAAETGEAEGYYWAGAAASGEDIVIGNESGKVALIDGATGKELSSVNVGTPVRSGIVAVGASTRAAGESFLAVSRNDGTLYRIVRTGDTLSIEGKVSFAATSTSTPAVANGYAFVCGTDADYYGTLSVIDLSTMTVVKTVRGGMGGAQSAPLVSVQGGEVFAYFTVNAMPGGVYSYHLGDDEAQLIYTPESDSQQYCTASVICDASGTLYYTNDSGTLFALTGAPFTDNGGDATDPGTGTDPVKPVDPGFTSKPGTGASGGTAAKPAPAISANRPTCTIPAANTPVEPASEDTSDKAAEAESADGQKAGKAEATESEATAESAASKEEASSADGEQAPSFWAMAGITVGAAGLALIVLYLVLSKFKKASE